MRTGPQDLNVYNLNYNFHLKHSVNPPTESRLKILLLQRKGVITSPRLSPFVQNHNFFTFFFLSFNPTAPPCSAGLDIGIVLDKSKSVKLPNLRIVIKFLGDLINKFDPAPEADHFGFITFHNKATLAFDFANSKYHNKDALLSRIANEPIQLELQTRTDKALKMARDELFTEAGGDRPDKPNVMIVLTDGKPTKLTGDIFKSFAEAISKEFKVCSLIKQF